jgi:hypothetical protein
MWKFSAAGDRQNHGAQIPIAQLIGLQECHIAACATKHDSIGQPASWMMLSCRTFRGSLVATRRADVFTLLAPPFDLRP